MNRTTRYEPFDVAIAPSPYLMTAIAGLWLAGAIAAGIVVAAYLGDRRWSQAAIVGAMCSSVLAVAAYQWKIALHGRWIAQVRADGRCVRRSDDRAIRIEWAVGAWAGLHVPSARQRWIVGPGSIRGDDAMRRWTTYARWALGRVDRHDASNSDAHAET